ncbi:helix-turn-helix domain-containing protein [Enterococcus casseliflavus]|uniref:helix-turn-helix domain-containing protein n=1 Tax=Enterococcus casseliflavus TaxID=37734 RepID=UPI0022E788D9|nr:helix-turn-helix transcriptional regulator [Enterococcus casseliflavus]
MLKVKLVLQKQIGNRIKSFRKSKGLNQKDFSAQYEENYAYMDYSLLSHIEKGKIKGKNSSYLTNAQINDFSSMMNCSIKELIFGNEEERIKLVKIILLRIIMNGSKSYKNGSLLNPIINVNQWNENLEEFLRLAMLNITNPDIKKRATLAYINNSTNKNRIEVKETIKECVNWYEENFGFFADVQNYEWMNIMLGQFNPKLQKASNLLINLLFSYTDFATDFMGGIDSLSELKGNQSDLINKFRANKGQFGDVAIDWKEAGYYKFIKAFNYMWLRNETKLIEHFDEEMFSKVCSGSSFKELDETFFENAIMSSKFNDQLFTILNDEKYNLETMLGHNIVSTKLQSIIIKSNIDSNERFGEGYNIYKYNYDIHQITQALIDFNESELVSNLFLFINQELRKSENNEDVQSKSYDEQNEKA